MERSACRYLQACAFDTLRRDEVRWRPPGEPRPQTTRGHWQGEGQAALCLGHIRPEVGDGVDPLVPVLMVNDRPSGFVSAASASDLLGAARAAPAAPPRRHNPVSAMSQ